MKWLPGAGRAGSWGSLPALCALAGALLLWTYADRLRESHAKLGRQLAPLERSRTVQPSQVEAARESLAATIARRNAVERRLRIDQSEQLVRARVLYELRNACSTAGIRACTVRLSEATVAARPERVSSGASSANAAVDLGSLGIGRARAIVSGGLVGDELEQFFAQLSKQSDAIWRVNGFSVRNSAFEVDVERHFIAAPPATRSIP